MWPLQRQSRFKIWRGRAGTCRTARPVWCPPRPRESEVVRESIPMGGPHTVRAVLPATSLICRPGWAPLSPPPSRALRGARTLRVRARCHREVAGEVVTRSDTACLTMAFGYGHLHRGSSASARGIATIGRGQLFPPRGSSRALWYIGVARVRKRKRPPATSSPPDKHRQPSAAPSNPGLHRTRCARR